MNMSEYKSERRKRKRKAGLCYDCPNKAEPNRVMCRKCLDRYNTYRKQKRREYIAQGRCGNCSGVPLVTKSLCASCLNRVSSTSREHRLRKRRDRGYEVVRVPIDIYEYLVAEGFSGEEVIDTLHRLLKL